MADPAEVTRSWCRQARGLLGLAPVPGAAAAASTLTAAAEAWDRTVNAVGSQLQQLAKALQATGDPRCRRIADYGLSGLTRRESVAMRAALLECRARDDATTRSRLTAAIAAYRRFLAENPLVPLLERNPLGVACAIRQPLAASLQSLEQALRT